MNYFGLSILFLTFSTLGICQCPTSDFAINNQMVSLAGCIEQAITIENQSTNAISYEWDFCAGDMAGLPTGTLVSTLTSVASYDAIKIVKESSSQYYGFIPKQASGGLFRLNFGSDLSLSPAPESLGALGLAGSTDIEFIFDGGIWYAIVACGNKLVRLKFSNGLGGNSASIISSDLGNFGGLIASVRGISLVKQGTDYYGLVASSTLNTITIIKFSGSMEGATSSIASPVTGASQLHAINVYKECDTWYAITTSVGNNRLINIQFGADLMNTSNFQYATVPGVSIQSYGMDLMVENDQYYVLLTTIGTPSIFYQLNFGSSVWSNSPTVINRGALSGLAACVAMDFVMKDSQVIGFIGNRTNYQLHRVNYPNSCLVSAQASSLAEPASIVYSNNGIYNVVLKAFDDDGNFNSTAKSLEIASSPAAAFTSTMNCVGQDVLFSDNSVSGFPSADVVEWLWDFAGLGNSSVQNPEFQFPYQGDYTINLSIKDSRGCVAALNQDVHIFNQNDIQPDFTFDPLVCSQGLELFMDASSFDEDVPKRWIWDFNKGEGIYTTQYTNHLFLKPGINDVSLIVTGSSGCSYNLTKYVNVVEGPGVDFDYKTNNCEDELLLFIGTSANEILNYSWDLGDGNILSGSSISHAYIEPREYTILLSGEGLNGCISNSTKILKVYSKPQASFTLDLPPFACSGSPSQFNDVTPPMPDSNITSWSWSFGDSGNGTSTQRNPMYTYSLAGDYNVSLTTTSNYGCSNSIQKSVSIYPSPKADFSFGPACVNQGTQFSDLSTGNIKSWLWSIQGNAYALQNPIHTFNSASTYSALLTVTDINNCVNQVSKNVMVPVAVVPDFFSSGTCATNRAGFDEITKGGTDPATSWTWNFANQGSATGSPAQYVFPAIGNYSVTMNTTRQSGCTYSVSKTIPIIEPPTAQFTVSIDAGGAPLPVDFVNTSLQASTYLWKFDDAANTSSIQFSPSFIYTELGDYNAELTATNTLGCSDSFIQAISVVVPKINAAISDFRLKNIPGSDNLNAVVTIENKSNVTLINPVVDLELSGNTTIIEGTQAKIKPNELYEYTFNTSIAPRSLEFACSEVKVNGDDYSFDNRQCVNLVEDYVSMIPYPNPAYDQLMLEWISDNDQPMDLVIYNAAGQVIISRQYSPTLKGLNQVKLDVTGLQEGIYFVSYSIDGQSQNFKFSVIR